ncbi:unnamed protein product [Chilo suppressalis]|uniref:Uncharacterized protein n=1 Tax=Chilo suppressalis TaxID=168631 RepID=A0ABN8B605_CHISP|nr:unnamed protein product [Chilo suppressalis]
MSYETEYDLCERVSSNFHDILNVNIYPFIENNKRIGTRGKNRPLVIEFSNKNITKYILRNTKYFKNTGLAIDIFMQGSDLEHRKLLRYNLQLAKKNGHPKTGLIQSHSNAQGKTKFTQNVQENIDQINNSIGISAPPEKYIKNINKRTISPRKNQIFQ